MTEENTGREGSDLQNSLAFQQAQPQISSATSVKIPPFWKQNPKLWFIQVEAAFKVNRITRSETKYDHIIYNLDLETLEFASDIIMATTFEGCKYEVLKKKLISAFTESDEKKLRHLLLGHAICDQKPSHYLQMMRNAETGHVSESVLRALFYEQMPEKIKIILTGNKGNLEQADKIMEQLNPSIFGIENNHSYDMSAILNKIDALEKRFDQVRPRSPDFLRSRNRSRTSSYDDRKIGMFNAPVYRYC
ncbi:uncharacterized protein LOC142235863 [Haematobia irritans]|uniref:uncharacterized protein LOC142235863 n=1 Tax=Haematobia irritans TaxID=7368 RepID=UPI003F50934D